MPLPSYSGPHPVGSIELEIPAPTQTFGKSVSKSTGDLILTHQSTLLTIFYPCEHVSYFNRSHPNWLDRPLGEVAAAYSNLGKIKSRFGQFGVYAALAIFGHHIKLAAYANAPLKRPEQGKQWPLVIFSHGLMGQRTTYSQYCGELASKGYVVAALEHRDGTCPTTLINSYDGSSRRLNYINPDTVKTPPNPGKMASLVLRGEQLQMRQAEISHALQIMIDLSSNSKSLLSQNLRSLPQSYNADAWSGSVKVEQSICAGHSFGAATTINVLRSSLASRFSMGIALDPWVDPIAEEPSEWARNTSSIEDDDAPSSPDEAAADPDQTNLQASSQPITIPLLIQNSEQFTIWTDHFQLVRKLVNSVKGVPTYFFTICGTRHHSFSDLFLIIPNLASSYFMGLRSSPLKDIQIMAQASDEFARGQRDGTLATAVDEGDKNGVRPGEGHWTDDGKRRSKPNIMGEPGEIRMHWKVET